MRITNRVLSKGYLNDLNRNLENMRKYQEQLSSGKEIRRPSDDPFKVARSMELNSSLMGNERYQKNIDEALGWLQSTDTALGQANDVLQNIRELVVYSSNGVHSDTEKETFKNTIQQYKEQLVEVANTSFDGRYVFNGDKTTEIPFTMSGTTVTYDGTNTNGLKKEFAPGIVLDIGITSNNFSKTSGLADDVFETIDKVIYNLENDISPTGLLNDIDKHIDNMLVSRGIVGARVNRLESMDKKNEEENFNMTELLSKTEDIDFAEKIMEYSVLESVYTASLQTGAKILQPSLLDFLR